MQTKIIHASPESHLLYIARVSSNQENTDPGLITYLIRQNHWSPFEMIGACVEIETTRDIGRQVLRHRSFSFQEFSQRYATVPDVLSYRDVRFKGTTNRQGSQLADSPEQDQIAADAKLAMADLAEKARRTYEDMIENGVAPECARVVLPEGLTPTRMYMNGTLRSWIHYFRERLKMKDGYPLAQREHYDLALSIANDLSFIYPATFDALRRLQYIDGNAVGFALPD